MQDLYIIAVYTAYCSVSKNNYLIAIVNNDKNKQSGLRFVLRENDFLYNSIIDKLESQNIHLKFDDFYEYILQHPILLGTGVIIESNLFKSIFNNIPNTIKDNNFILLAPPTKDTSKQYNPILNYIQCTYSLELYSLLRKGNYIYSSLQYQKRAIKELISMIRNDYIHENYLNISYSELIAEKIRLELTDSDDITDNNLKIIYPSFNAPIDNLWGKCTDIVQDFYYGFAIIKDSLGIYYIIDIKGNDVINTFFDCISGTIMPLKIASTSSNLSNYTLLTYIENTDEVNDKYTRLTITVNNANYQTFIGNKYKKFFRYKDYDLLYFYSPNDNECNEYQYDSCTVFIYKGLDYITDYDNIKDIDKTYKDGYFIIKKVNSDDPREKGIYNNPIRKEALGLVKIDNFGRFKRVIHVSRCYYRIRHIIGKIWIVWGREDFGMNYNHYCEIKNLTLEKCPISYSDMSGTEIENSKDARIFHEDKGFITSYGEYQSYNIGDYDSETVVVLYSGSYYKFDKNEPWPENEYTYKENEYIYQEEEYCYCLNMDGDSYRIFKNDPELGIHIW